MSIRYIVEKQSRKINKAKRRFLLLFEKMIRTGKPLARPIKQKGRKYKVPSLAMNEGNKYWFYREHENYKKIMHSFCAVW